MKYEKGSQAKHNNTTDVTAYRPWGRSEGAYLKLTNTIWAEHRTGAADPGQLSAFPC